MDLINNAGGVTQANRYTYAACDPVNFVDQMGMSPIRLISPSAPWQSEARSSLERNLSSNQGKRRRFCCLSVATMDGAARTSIIAASSRRPLSRVIRWRTRSND
jgi:hypothetical protein